MSDATPGIAGERSVPSAERTIREGVIRALAAAVLFGASAPLAKALLRGVTPQLLAGLLYLGSGAGLLVLWLVRRGRRHAPEAALTRRDAPWLAGAIASGGVLGPLFLMIGLSRTPASSASLLLNLEGVLTAGIAWVVFRENVDRRIALGMAFIVAGGLLVSWTGLAELGGAAGPLAIVGACLCWAVDNNLTQKVSAGDPVQIAMLKGVVAGSVNTGIALALGAHFPTPWRLAASLSVGFAGYGLSLVLFVLALRSLGTARTGAYFSTAPFVGAALALVMFHDPVTVPLALGALCMAAGVWLHATERHEHLHTHEPLEHEHAHVHDAHHQHAHGPEDPAVVGADVPHTHPHRHEPLIHTHVHTPDIHHRHGH